MKMKNILIGAMVIAGLVGAASAATPEVNYKRCAVCHGKAAEKVPPGGTVTILSLKDAKEAASLMKKYRDDKTYGGKMKISMQTQMKAFKNDADIDALSEYIFKTFKK